MHEAQVLAEVLAKVGEALERNVVPEPAATPTPEQSLAHDLRDGAVRREIVGHLDAVRPQDAEPLKTWLSAPLDRGEDAGVRTCVDQQPIGREDPVNFS
jgi:hypothetical protein